MIAYNSWKYKSIFGTKTIEINVNVFCNVPIYKKLVFEILGILQQNVSHIKI